MKIISLILISTLLICSCSNGVVTNVNTKQNVGSRSVIIDEDNFLTDTIYVGDVITHKPLTSQIISVDGKEKYLLLDQSKLYQFDWETGVLEDSVDLGKCGSLVNYSGFCYNNKDSIYVYDYNSNTLCLANSEGHILKKRSGLKEVKRTDYEALNQTRIIGIRDYVILSGGKLGDISDMNQAKRVVSQKVKFNNSMPEDIISYPDIYNEGFWGGVYLNEVSHVLVDKNQIIYSFPVDHYIRTYNLQTGRVDSIYMGSKYTDAIKSCSDNPIELFMDKDARIVYYVKEHSYDNIMYDNNHELILRFACHPLNTYDGGWFIKPFSIIAYNLRTKELSESAIFKDYANLNTSNMHICKDGIAIATFENKDETKIVFKIFKYKKS